MHIEVVYALATEQMLYSLELPEGATVRAALQQSGILQKHAELDITQLKLGIFSRFVDLETRLTSGDRIEIYRPLTIDPKQARLLRVKKKR